MSLSEDFKQRFPEFDASAVDTYIPILGPVWPCFYGGKYEDGTKCDREAILNLLAHLMVIEQAPGSGNVKREASKSVGSVSVSYSEGYASTSERMDWLRSTKYGSRYLLLTRSRQGAVFV